MTRRILKLAGKDLRDILRERSIVLALVTQLFVAAFSAFLTFGLVGLYDPQAIDQFPETDVAYVGPGGFDVYLEDAGNLDVTRPATVADAIQAFQDGDVRAVVQETHNGTEGERNVTIMMGEGEVQTTLLVTQLRDLLRNYERDLREERSDRIEQQLVFVETDADPGVFFGFAFGILLPLLVATPVFLSGAITGDALSQEMNTKTILLLRASPISTFELVAGKLTTPVLLAPAQVWLWILLLQANGIPVQNVGWLLAATGVWALVLAAAGLLVAMAFPRQGHAQAAYTLLVLVVASLSLALPQSPLNLVARLAVGNPSIETFVSLAINAVIAAALFAGAWWAASRRFGATGS